MTLSDLSAELNQDELDSSSTSDVIDFAPHFNARLNPFGFNVENINEIVWDFPMRAFTRFTLIKTPPSALKFEKSNFTPISRFKREITYSQQCDHPIVATNQSIFYVFPQQNGLRMIKQSDGSFADIFSDLSDKVINPSVCQARPISPHQPLQTLLAISQQSGSIHHATLIDQDNNVQDEKEIERSVLSIPWPPYPDSGTASKNNGTFPAPIVKHSSQTPQFFAASAGSDIYILHPADALSNLTKQYPRIVNTRQMIRQKTRTINIYRPVLDFFFSHDDTVIGSLNDRGQLDFWDLRPFTRESNSVTVKSVEPITSVQLDMFKGQGQSNPTLITFLDKEKTFVKGQAERYFLVGLERNHVLQLWDFGINRVVQEIEFPWETRDDEPCSVFYHFRTATIGVVHPSRNSIYFITVSAPKYSLMFMEQAKYLDLLSVSDSSVPTPKTTAIMISMREISFSKLGKIHGCDIVPNPNPGTDEDGNEIDAPLFDMYAVHSQGVCILSVRIEDLGWNENFQPLRKMNLMERGLVHIGPLGCLKKNNLSSRRDLSLVSKGSSSDGQLSHQDKSLKKPNRQYPSKQNQPQPIQQLQQQDQKSPGSQPKIPPIHLWSDIQANAPRKPSTGQSTNSTAEVPGLIPVSQQAKRPPAASTSSANARVDLGYQKPQPITDLRNESPLSIAFGADLSNLTSNNVPPNSKNNTKFEQAMAPKKIPGGSSKPENEEARQGSKLAVSQALNEELREGNLLTSVFKDEVSGMMNPVDGTNKTDLVLTLKNDLVAAIRENIHESMPELVTVISQSAKKSIEDSIVDKFQQLDLERSRSLEKVESMHGCLSTLIESVNNVLTSNLELQSKVASLSEKIDSLEKLVSETEEQRLIKQQQSLRDSAQTAGDAVGAVDRSKTAGHNASWQPPLLEKLAGDENQNIAEVARAMQMGVFTKATLLWVKSHEPHVLFDRLFRFVNPAFVQHLPPSMALLIAGTVTKQLTDHVVEKLNWLEAVLDMLTRSKGNPFTNSEGGGPMDGSDLHKPNQSTEESEDVRMIPHALDLLSMRIHSLYMLRRVQGPNDDLVRRLPKIVDQAKDLKERLGTR